MDSQLQDVQFKVKSTFLALPEVWLRRFASGVTDCPLDALRTTPLIIPIVVTVCVSEDNKQCVNVSR